jgi:hypothetical protein
MSQKKILGYFGVIVFVLAVGLLAALRQRRDGRSTEAKPAPSVTVANAAFPAAVSPDVARSPLEQNRFARMSTLERNQEVDRMRKLDAASLFKLWIESDRIEHDRSKQSLVGELLARALRLKDASIDSVYSEMKEYLGEKTNSLKSRSMLLSVLGNAATPDSLNLLLFAATASSLAGISQFAVQQIQASGAEHWDGRFHEELSPALEQVWRTSTNSALIQATALAIAMIGSQEGTRELIAAATSGAHDDPRAQAALEALHHITNPDAVPVLSELLNDENGINDKSILIGSTLAQMLDYNSAAALLSWLEQSDDSVAPFAEKFVMECRTDAVLKVWESALKPTTVFQSVTVQQAVVRGLHEYHASRRSSL